MLENNASFDEKIILFVTSKMEKILLITKKKKAKFLYHEKKGIRKIAKKNSYSLKNICTFILFLTNKLNLYEKNICNSINTNAWIFLFKENRY